MTKLGKVSIIAGLALSSVGILKMGWTLGNFIVLLTGALLAITLIGLLLWWRFK